jgi:O-antigen/teichoic acid export membrane protein
MNSVQKIAKNTFVLLISQIITVVLGFVYIIYSAKYLGVDGFGTLSFALAFAGIFGIFSDLGLCSLATREISRDKSKTSEYLGNLFIIKISLGILTFGLIALTINLLNYPYQTILVVYLIGLSVILTNINAIFNSVFQAYEKLEYQSIGQIINSLLLFIGIFVAIYLEFDILGFSLVYLITSFVVFIYSFIISKTRFASLKLKINWYFWKFMFKEALPLSLAAIFSVIAFRIDTVMLSIIIDNNAVGLYTAAYRLIESLTFVPIVFTASIYPVFSKLHISSQDSLRLSYYKSFKYLIMIGIPIGVGTTILAEKIILLIYGYDFVESIHALQVLIWLIPIFFLTYMFRWLLVSINKQNLLLKILLICMCLNIILNLILIPYFSFIGASLITLITELISFIFCYYYLSTLICKIQIGKILVKPIIASIIMSIFLLIFIENNILLLILISIILYFGVLITLNAFSNNDKDLFKQIINLKRFKRKVDKYE